MVIAWVWRRTSSAKNAISRIDAVLQDWPAEKSNILYNSVPRSKNERGVVSKIYYTNGNDRLSRRDRGSAPKESVESPEDALEAGEAADSVEVEPLAVGVEASEPGTGSRRDLGSQLLEEEVKCQAMGLPGAAQLLYWARRQRKLEVCPSLSTAAPPGSGGADVGNRECLRGEREASARDRMRRENGKGGGPTCSLAGRCAGLEAWAVRMVVVVDEEDGVGRRRGRGWGW
ncbi:hypothetical protein DFH09DRAFT_1085355 [Mycena vulgaris]|nr:hypothetical protein DFH09DRAFT_1085355 [Mycena vulgaris]